MGAFDFFRGAGELHVGNVLQVPGMRASIVALDADGFARHVRFDFDGNLDDSVQSIYERETGFEEVKLPPVGVGVRLVP